MEILPVNMFNNYRMLKFGTSNIRQRVLLKSNSADTVSFKYEKSTCADNEPYRCGTMYGQPMDKTYATKAIMLEISKKSEDIVQRANNAYKDAAALKEEVKSTVSKNGKSSVQTIIKKNNKNTFVIIPKDNKTVIASLDKNKNINTISVLNANGDSSSVLSKDTYIYDTDGSLKQYTSSEYTQGQRKTRISYGKNTIDEEKKEGTRACSKKENSHLDFNDERKIDSLKFSEQIFNNGSLTYKRTISRIPNEESFKGGYEICEDVFAKDRHGKEKRVHKGFVKYDY